MGFSSFPSRVGEGTQGRGAGAPAFCYAIYMLVTKKQLEKLDVITQSGDYLGKVVEFELDSDTGILMRISVKTSQPIVGLFEDALLISRDAIVSFTDKTIVVLDDHRIAAGGSGGRRLPAKGPSPVITKGL